MMFLAIDAGNTQTAVALFKGSRIQKTWRTPSRPADIARLARSLPKADRAVIAIVVPPLKPALARLARKCTGRAPLFVSTRLKMPIRIRLPHPNQLGQDRIANAVAAYAISGGGASDRKGARSLLVVDFGTATTIDVITAKGDYIGGTISPGIGIANLALHEKTALLPLVPIKKPRRAVGNDTLSAIQSGVFYGYAGLIDGLVKKIQKELGSKVKVIATGGLSTLVGPACKTINVIDPDLTLKGLCLLYEWSEA